MSTYTRLSHFTLADVEAIDNALWDSLSDTEKKAYANSGQAKLADLRYKNNKSQYNFDSLGDSNIYLPLGGANNYIALLTQAGVAAPTPTIVSNTLSGVPIWSRVSTGVYYATLVGEFLAGKVFGSAFVDTSNLVSDEKYAYVNRISDDVVELTVQNSLTDLTDEFNDLRVIIAIYS